MKASLTLGLQWLVLLVTAIHMWPTCVITGLVLVMFGNRPLLIERGIFDSDGTPVRYQTFSLQFSPGREHQWLVDFIRQYNFEGLPAIYSGLRGWVSPAAVGRICWLPAWRKCIERWP